MSPETRNPELETAPPPPLRAAAALAAAVGLFAQTAQIVMFREMLAACRGTEVFFGVVLAAGLGWAALGGLAAGVVARRGRRRFGQAWPQRAWSFAAALFALNGLLLVGQIALARHRGTAGAAAELTFVQATITALIATAPVALSCGAQFVLALQVARADDFAKLYRADALGAAAGGLLFTFVLVSVVGPVTVGPMLGAALCLFVHLRGGRRWMATGFVLGLTGAVAVWGYGLDERLHRRRWQALQPGYHLVATQDSRYGHLAVLRHPEVEQHTLYHDGALVETLPPPGAPATDARNLALFVAAQHPEPRSILLVGQSLGQLPGELLAVGFDKVTALELDPALFDLAREIRPASEDARIERRFADARRTIKWLNRPGDSFDVVLLRVPAPLSAFVNRLYTAEFFEEAHSVLNGDGVLVTSVMAAANYPGETVGQLSATLLRTLKEVFPEVLVAPGESHTFIAGTCPGLVSLDPAVLGRRFAARGIWLDDADPDFRSAPDAYYEARFANLIVSSQVDGLRETLEAVDAPVNTDAQPIAFQYALLVWNQIVSADPDARDPGLRGGTNALFRAALRFRFAHGLVLPAVVLIPGLVLLGMRRRGRVYRRGAAYGVLATAFATGLFGMAAEIMLLYAYQTAHGYAYTHVGLLVAAFMLGLATGAEMGSRARRLTGFLVTIVGLMILYCLVAPGIVTGLAGEWRWMAGVLPHTFLLLTFLAGALDGATFPPLVGVLRRAGLVRPGAWVYAADLAGAGLGALATGALLLPLLGSGPAFLLVAATLLAALVCLLALLRCPRTLPVGAGE